MIEKFIGFVREQYRTSDFIPLHAPVFAGREREYVMDTIDSTFVSSVGEYVDRFEKDVADYTGSLRAVATVNGTAALHIALRLVGVDKGDLVITQPLTFVATCNAIAYCNAEPVFVDVSLETLGMCPDALSLWLNENAFIGDDGICRTIVDRKAIKACVPMHTFGHAVELDSIVDICNKWHIALVEDAAESLGSYYKERHTGTFGKVGVLSFNGNKIITTGGGGMILTERDLAEKAKHLTTTAKVPHPYNYNHDEVGYNYRLPNINAAIGCAQLELIEKFVSEKRLLAERYSSFFKNSDYTFFQEPAECRSNYWLNALICEDQNRRDSFLKETNSKGVMSRPIWCLMNHLSMYKSCRRGDLGNAEWLEQRVVNIPSSFILDAAR